MNKPTLAVLAAGIGHRYGGLKQIESVGPSGEIVIDYSVFDAIGAGFGKLLFVIRREIEDIPGFPPATAQAVLHIILSHHGSLEHGSPIVPATREATLVHMIDNLGGRLGSFDRLEKELAPGAVWSNFDRAISGGAFFGPVGEPVAERAAA